MKEKFPAKNTTNEVKDEVTYCKKLMEVIEKEPQVAQIPAVKERLNLLKEVVEDYQTQLSYSSDEDARKGHKTADSSFFGYKTPIALSNERIITAAVITTGEKSDGKYLQELIEKSKQAGMEVDTVMGDTAYSEKANIEYTKKEKIALISKLNPVISEGNRKEEDQFEYNKDAGRFVSQAGHLAIRKARTDKKGQSKNQKETYYFDIEKCKVCPLRDGCYKEGAKSKTYSISLKSKTHEEQLTFQQTDEFIPLAKERYKMEAKKSELKMDTGTIRHRLRVYLAWRFKVSQQYSP